jgi:hypothetical protein
MEIKEKDPLYEDEDENFNDRLTENEMDDIIAYINSWDYEKYQRDKEIREALQLLKSKMIKDEKEKEKELNKLKKTEYTYTLNGKIPEKNEINNNNLNKEEDNENYINNYNYLNNEYNDDNKEENNNINKGSKELTEEEKLILEKNWNNSTKIERNGQIINEKGDKDILLNNDTYIDEKKEILKVKINYLFNIFL